jgi:hypothetical protein
MNDYRLTFPVTALVAGLSGIEQLRAELQSDTVNRVDALGDPRDSTGAIVYPDPNAPPGAPPPDVWYGRPGSPASTFTDLNGNVVQVPARGDPSLYYVHIRSELPAGEFDPTQHGMRDANAVDSAQVLGIWLGDAVPV